MQKYYHTVVEELGEDVYMFRDAKMLIMFGDNAPVELRDYCVLHHENALTDTVKAGDILRLGSHEYPVVYVGSEVQKNLRDLGHITLRFDGNAEGESLEGSLYLADLPVADVEVGDEIALLRP